MSDQDRKRATDDAQFCPSCGTRCASGDRFCRGCGAPLQGTAKPNGRLRRLAGLRAFGLIIIALAVVYAFLYYGDRERDRPPAQPIDITDVGSATGGTGGTGVGEATQPLTGRMAADQLFNQAMSAYETGDSASARQFIPMAISAYQTLDDLDLDGRYHIALLSLAAGQPRTALAQADTMLDRVDEHLLALSVSARAYAALGEAERAVERYRRFLAAYTPTVAASRTEYMDHARALPARREEAESYLRARGLSPEGS